MSKFDKSEKKEDNGSTWIQFKLCKNKCFACNECGYFWGTDESLGDKRGKPLFPTTEKK